MSFHEELLNQTFHGVGWASGFGLFLTLGIALSCICRLNAMKPSALITSEQALYLALAFWSMEAFTDLLFFRMFSGHDFAIGGGALLYLHSTYKDWQGDDCISDALNWWRLESKQRREEIRRGVKYGRRASDRR